MIVQHHGPEATAFLWGVGCDIIVLNMNNRIFILIFVVAVFILGGVLYINNPEPTEYVNPNEEKPVACTTDAKLCPDGSYVGRSGPNCEFDVCPIPPGTMMEDGTIQDANN